MRVVLGCSLGGSGHLTPIVAVAQAARRLGHEPLLLVPPALAERAAASGMQYAVGDQPPRSVVDDIWQRVRAGPPEAVVGLIDRELFADRATDAMLAAATALCARVAPQLIVREPCEYATATVAQRTGIPQLQIAISQARIEHGVLADVSDVLERRAPGVTAAIEAAPFLSSFPASLDPSPWSDTHRFRSPSAARAPLPDWWPGDTRPLVYVTFGSVLGGLLEARAVYRAALDAVDGLPIRVLLTVGSAFDLGALGPIPANTRVERWVAQEDVVASARLVVCHGGSGTVFGALAAGLPLVVCPLFADQTANATLIERAGAGVVVTATRAPAGGVGTFGHEEVERLRAAIGTMLAAPGARDAARRIAAEVAATPTLDEVLGDLFAELPSAQVSDGARDDRRPT